MPPTQNGSARRADRPSVPSGRASSFETRLSRLKTAQVSLHGSPPRGCCSWLLAPRRRPVPLGDYPDQLVDLPAVVRRHVRQILAWAQGTANTSQQTAFDAQRTVHT